MRHISQISNTNAKVDQQVIMSWPGSISNSGGRGVGGGCGE